MLTLSKISPLGCAQLWQAQFCGTHKVCLVNTLTIQLGAWCEIVTELILQCAVF